MVALFLVALFSGLLAVVIGLMSWGSLAWNKRAHRRAQSIAELGVARIASSAGVDPIALHGKIVESEEGTFVSPLGGHDVVGFRAWTVHQGYHTSPSTHLLETRFGTFLLDDGSGARARIESKSPELIGKGQRMSRAAQTKEKEQYLRAHDSRWSKYMPTYEIALCPGDTVFVVGFASRGEVRSGGGYREEPHAELVVHPTLVSIRSPEDTVRFLDRPYRQARYGLLFAAVNLVVFAVTYPTWSMLRDRQREQAFTEFNRGLESDPPAVSVPDVVDDGGCNPDFNDCTAVPPRRP